MELTIQKGKKLAMVRARAYPRAGKTRKSAMVRPVLHTRKNLLPWEFTYLQERQSGPSLHTRRDRSAYEARDNRLLTIAESSSSSVLSRGLDEHSRPLGSTTRPPSTFFLASGLTSDRVNSHMFPENHQWMTMLASPR